jgi:hypothetical protein
MSVEKVKLESCKICGKRPRFHLGKKFYCQLHGDESQPWVAKCCVTNIEDDDKNKVVETWNKLHDSRTEVLDEVLEEFDKINPGELSDDAIYFTCMAMKSALKQIIQKAKEQKR